MTLRVEGCGLRIEGVEESLGSRRHTDGDGAAVDIDLSGVDLEGVDVVERDDGEGLVDLPQVDVVYRQPVPLSPRACV